jgi:2-polyprenyl-3-methyl-5-hydroxy-6-metoxy-1,4-benzoquinol methylase
MQREALIADLVRGRRVLDVGSLGQSADYCLWKMIDREAASLMGIDLPDAQQTARALLQIPEAGLQHHQDPRIVLGNMETVDLGMRFEVVTAGDVIEHVSNPGGFLDNIYRHLEHDGRLIITTPNAKWPTVFLKPNLTHVLWHDRYTLNQLLIRHGFELELLRYYLGNKPRYAWWQKPLLIRQQLFAVARRGR